MLGVGVNVSCLVVESEDSLLNDLKISLVTANVSSDVPVGVGVTVIVPETVGVEVIVRVPVGVAVIVPVEVKVGVLVIVGVNVPIEALQATQ